MRQPLAVVVDADLEQPQPLYPDREKPKLVIRPVDDQPADRLLHGGSRIGVEFDSEEEDLLRAVDEGAEYVEDFLTALSLSAGTPFAESSPLQIARPASGSSVDFLRFLSVDGSAWPEPLTASEFAHASRIQHHWRDLDGGHRLRRGARRYKRALASQDPVDAFQHAYSGLESLERPLADEVGLTPGAEVVTGTCDSCGQSYEYKKSVLAGVRAFISGETHGELSDHRISEWRALRNLRNGLVHGFEDLQELSGRTESLMATICHYLHDASAHLAHAHELESEQFALKRLGRLFVLKGRARQVEFPNLVEQVLFVEAEPLTWHETAEHGLVPEFGLTAMAGVEGGAFSLDTRYGARREADLVPARFEVGGI